MLLILQPSIYVYPCFLGQSSAGKKGAVKIHTLLDLRDTISSILAFSNGKMHDIYGLDLL